MAVDAFLKIDGIDGESVDETYKDSIEVSSFSWGVTNASTSATGGAGAGKAQFQDFHFTTNTSKASPKLMLACASGQHIKKAQLFCRKAGGENRAALTFVKIYMEDVLISSYQMGGSGDIPVDQVSFNFAKISFTYVLQNADGGAGTAVTAGWDLKANKSL